MDDIFRIVKLLQQQEAGGLDDAGQKELEAWMEKEENCRLAQRLLSEAGVQEALKTYRKYDADRAYARFASRVSKGSPKQGRRVSLHRWVWLAAGMALLLCGSILFLGRERMPRFASEAKIGPVVGKAVLVLGNGEAVSLGHERAFYERDTNGVYVTGDSIGLVYQKSGEGAGSVFQKKELVYNKLIVPRGGEYALQLSDSTKIWVNSESELRYPETFGADVRVVDLKGEAYFSVTKDSVRPFIVRTGGMELRVLGTEFNVNAYEDGDGLVTTLVSGKVALRAGNASLMLEPGEQAVLSVDGFSKELVNVQRVVAWKDGVVAFEDERLEDLMDKLSRWYDVQVFYQNADLQDVRITGYIDRYKDIQILLDKLEMLDLVEFEVRGRTITVREKL